MIDAEHYEKRNLQEALRHLSHAYESVDAAITAVRKAKHPELVDSIDDLQDAILERQSLVMNTITAKFEI